MTVIDTTFDRVFDELRAERAEFKAEMAAFRGDLGNEMRAMRGELTAEIHAINHRLTLIGFGLAGILLAGLITSVAT
jgi:hypothetical protein